MRTPHTVPWVDREKKGCILAVEKNQRKEKNCQVRTQSYRYFEYTVYRCRLAKLKTQIGFAHIKSPWSKGLLDCKLKAPPPGFLELKLRFFSSFWPFYSAQGFAYTNEIAPQLRINNITSLHLKANDILWETPTQLRKGLNFDRNNLNIQHTVNDCCLTPSVTFQSVKGSVVVT